jgi:ComF family protein
MFGKSLSSIGQNVLDALLPPICPVTKTLVDAPGALSPEAWSGLQFIGDQVCAACGHPFDYAGLEGQLCAVCEARLPHVSRTRSALVYNDTSKALILALKNGGHTDGVARLADWMVNSGQALLHKDVCLVPVPLHMRRRIVRRFNQSALLGRAIAKKTGARFCPHYLDRHRHTPSQAGRNAKARKRNVAGAFGVSGRVRDTLKGRHIVLIDDVRTTGATLNACARPLLAAGCVQVDALTLARIVKPAEAIT